MIALMQLTVITMANVLTFKPLGGFQPSSVSVILDGSEELALSVRKYKHAY